MYLYDLEMMQNKPMSLWLQFQKSTALHPPRVGYTHAPYFPCPVYGSRGLKSLETGWQVGLQIKPTVSMHTTYQIDRSS